MTVFWLMIPCSLVCSNKYFAGASCLQDIWRVRFWRPVVLLVAHRMTNYLNINGIRQKMEFKYKVSDRLRPFIFPNKMLRFTSLSLFCRYVSSKLKT